MPRSRLHPRIALSVALLCAVLTPALPAQDAKPAAPAQYAALSQWRIRAFAEDGFSAELPIEPGMEKKILPTPAGNFEMRSYLVIDGSAALRLSICDYGTAIAGKDPAAVLQGAKNGALQNSGSHLLNERKLALGSNPGLEFEAESDTIHTTDRLYLIGNMLYQVQVSAPVTEPYPQAARFLDSFQLIPRTELPH